MAQRSAHFTRTGEHAEEPDESSVPVFATCVLGLGGIRVSASERD